MVIGQHQSLAINHHETVRMMSSAAKLANFVRVAKHKYFLKKIDILNVIHKKKITTILLI